MIEKISSHTVEWALPFATRRISILYQNFSYERLLSGDLHGWFTALFLHSQGSLHSERPVLRSRSRRNMPAM